MEGRGPSPYVSAMVYMITHGNHLAEATIPRRTARSALRAVRDLQEEAVGYIRIEDPDGRVISVHELSDIVQAETRPLGVCCAARRTQPSAQAVLNG